MFSFGYLEPFLNHPTADSPHTAGPFVRGDCAVPYEEKQYSIFIGGTVSIRAKTERTVHIQATEPL